MIADIFMMLGLLGLYGILLGRDGADYSPLLMIIGLSFLSTGILYPIWAIRLGRWILAAQADPAAATAIMDRGSDASPKSQNGESKVSGRT